MQPRVLFILKRQLPGPYGAWNYSSSGTPPASGLFISALQMSKALEELGVETKLVHVIDNNCIDREVTAYKPTHVIIEAFWVVPSKFAVLKKLHPKVQWVVRNHSKPSFLATEGGMIGWAIDYMQNGVIVASNSREATDDLTALAKAAGISTKQSVYLPNFYQANKPVNSKFRVRLQKLKRMFGFNEGRSFDNIVRVGCFGAIRPLKNHLLQAIAAIQAAEKMNVSLHFWINSNRIEGKADPFLRSIRELFVRFPRHHLVELDWQKHDDFLKVIQKMDVVVQVSHSETFNIVAADAVGQGVPVVGSAELPWLNMEYTADPNCSQDICDRILQVLQNSYSGLLQDDQLYDLRAYATETKRHWANFLTVDR